MAQAVLTLDDIRRMAADIGLTRFSEPQLQELLSATRVSLERRGKLKSDRLTYADEPAHVFSLDTGSAR